MKGLRGWAAACVWTAGCWPLSAAPVAVTSDVHTVRFGVETQWPDSTALENQHADLVVYFCGGVGEPRWRTDPPTAFLGLHEAHGYVNESSRETMTEALLPEYAFIGAAAGETFWYLNQSQIAGQLYLGMRATGPESDRLLLWDPREPDHYGDGLAVYIRVVLVDVRGPPGGHFSLFQFGTAGPAVYLSSVQDGADAGAYFYYSAGGHDHYNWAFSRPGLYEIDLRLTTVVDWDPEAAATTIRRHERAGEGFVTEWTCDPCARYRLEGTDELSTESVWVPIGPDGGWSSAEGLLAVTNSIPDGASQVWRIVASP